MTDALRRRFIAKRKELGLSQKQVAKQSGVSLRAISAFETGESMPQRSNMEALLEVVPVPIEPAAEGPRPEPTEVVTRAWPPDVSVFLDVLGAYLTRFPEDERLGIIHDMTRQIFLGRPRHESE